MKNTVSALDFGTCKIVALTAETGVNQRCDITGAGTASYDGFMDGQWNAPDELNSAIESAIKECELQSHTRIREINIGVPGDFSQIRTVEAKVELQGPDPHVTAKDIDALFSRATEALGDVRGDIIHRSPAWFIVDDGKKTQEPMGLRGYELRGMVSFVIADPFFLNDVSGRLHDMNIAVTGCFSTCTGQAIMFVPEDERDRTAVVIDVGYLNTEVMTVEGEALTSLKVIPMGGGNIAADVAYGLDIPLTAAEQIKRQYVYGLSSAEGNYDITDSDGNNQSYEKAKVKEVLEPRVEELCKAIADAIKSSGVKLSNWSPVYLTGGGLVINRGGRDYLAKVLDKPVREFPRRAVKLSSPAYSTSLGLLNLVIDTVCKVKNTSGISGFFRNLFGA
ncbi:MAG: hypothetical protein CW338_06350 [Clostridiales bacterium]|nr:hypothetical protein [Clostridiales bacterium]